MLEMTKPVHHTGKVVSMDSGLCVLVGIIAMHIFGVYGQSIIKKGGTGRITSPVTLLIHTLQKRNLAVPKHSGRFLRESLSLCIFTRAIGMLRRL